MHNTTSSTFMHTMGLNLIDCFVPIIPLWFGNNKFIDTVNFMVGSLDSLCEGFVRGFVRGL